MKTHTIDASTLNIEIERARRDDREAGLRLITALADLENAAAERMPSDTLMRRVAKVAEEERAFHAASLRISVLTQIRDGALE